MTKTLQVLLRQDGRWALKSVGNETVIIGTWARCCREIERRAKVLGVPVKYETRPGYTAYAWVEEGRS